MKRAPFVVGLVSIALLGGILSSCGKLGGGSKQESLLDVIPEKALAAVVIRADALKMFRQQLDEDVELNKELHEYLVKREGIDPTRVTAMVAFTTAPDARDGAAFLRMPLDGMPKWEKVADADGVPLYKVFPPIVAAVLPTGLLLGTEPGVRLAISTIQKKTPAISKTSVLAPMLEADASAQLIVGGSIDAASDPQLKPVAGLYGVKAVTFGYAPTKIWMWADGEPAGLKGARDAAKGFIDLGLEQAKKSYEKAIVGDSTIEGAASIVGYRSYIKMAPKVTPRLEGNRLVLDYAIPKSEGGGDSMMAMTAVATVGVLSAVAIPAFMKYIRRSKTVEATMNLRKLFDSEISYYESEHADDKGNILPRGFAPSSDWTPAKTCCGKPGDKCQPDEKTFAGATWQALNFSLDDPYYYQYRVVQKPDGFIVEARGDLDCDGVFSLFRREGRVTADGNVTGGMGLYSENDIE